MMTWVWRTARRLRCSRGLHTAGDAVLLYRKHRCPAMCTSPPASAPGLHSTVVHTPPGTSYLQLHTANAHLCCTAPSLARPGTPGWAGAAAARRGPSQTPHPAAGHHRTARWVSAGISTPSQFENPFKGSTAVNGWWRHDIRPYYNEHLGDGRVAAVLVTQQMRSVAQRRHPDEQRAQQAMGAAGLGAGRRGDLGGGGDYWGQLQRVPCRDEVPA